VEQSKQDMPNQEMNEKGQDDNMEGSILQTEEEEDEEEEKDQK
jgi:hypothetical protein